MSARFTGPGRLTLLTAWVAFAAAATLSGSPSEANAVATALSTDTGLTCAPAADRAAPCLDAGVPAADPPPAPSPASKVGDSVTNPVTNATTTVSALDVDPVGTPTAGSTAFVETADGYIFMVKTVGQTIYNGDVPPVGFAVLSQDTTAGTVRIQAPGQQTPVDLPYQTLRTTAAIQALLFPPGDTAGDVNPPTIVGGASGVKLVFYGRNGSNGRAGALVVPPSRGGSGDPGPAVPYTTTFNIATSNQIGIEAGSLGGTGGTGGNSYASFWDGASGGNGGAGGPVTVTNAPPYQVGTTGDNMHGIFAYSKGGAAGNGGTGYAAPGGGTGGHSSDGGAVRVENGGTIITGGHAASGIYGLSVSNNGGSGGNQWGLVGEAGSGGFGGSGGPVTITNDRTGSIDTSGNFSHGILAQSIGGSGGSDGTAGNLVLSLNGSPDNGGNGGAVAIQNDGAIVTRGTSARGIFAQSIGGGGGAGNSTGGLIALGGSGSNGGSGAAVSVTNGEHGKIHTIGIQSDAIFAQSVGGSGGSGSNAGGLISVGGSGARGGDGSTVSVSNFGEIVTDKDLSRGIVAQSIGGGGGDGGSSDGVVSVGGSGKGGGSSGVVTVVNGGEITTTGVDATGILAQSVGGGGGNGGSAGSIGVFAGVAIGGTGDGGGTGRDVNVTLQGQGDGTASLIKTKGDRSTALFAQSVGGGGGTGGGAVQVTGGFGAAASFAVGGNGGAGGNAGTVKLATGGGISHIQTGGEDATGVFLQSVGGGGGTGGYSVSVAESGGPVSGSISSAVGGDGGTAGLGGTVRVGTFDGSGTLVAVGFDGDILTTGNRSTGFLAQSVGGGGGNGGLAVSAAGSGSLLLSGSVALGVGGKGKAGGAGGTVMVGIKGDITTTGADATALLAQSVGGGGGNGGGSIAATLAASAGGAGTIGVAIGGAAGDGSYSQQVTLATKAGTISTTGPNSSAIVAQSVGGGGGNGGYTVSAGGAAAGAGAAAVNLGLGGTGGSGGLGGTVKADIESTVKTSGQNSGGVLVQSVGGGGGNGGFDIVAAVAGAGAGSGAVTVGLGGSGGVAVDAGSVTATSTGTISTGGDRSSAFVAQSIGGGGGSGGYNVSAAAAGAGIGSGAVGVELGGQGKAGGAGGAVTATTTGAIATAGAESTGVLAQSVGGGGGNGGFNVTGTGAGSGVGSGAVSVGLGGSGGAGGAAGAVTLTVQTDVGTAGNRSAAVVAQSIGGGGGNGGFNVSGAAAGAGVGSGSVSVGLGGDGGGGGHAGVVDATVAGRISTAGESAVGILAQAVGGGGGNGGFNVSGALSAAGVGGGAVTVGLGGRGGTASNGGASSLLPSQYAVTLDTSGTVVTQGTGSAGTVAQSVGGGGGNGGFNLSTSLSGAGVGSGGITVGLGGTGGGGGNGLNVLSSIGSDVSTFGTDSSGVVTQSIGGGGGNGGFNLSSAISGAGIGSGGISVGLGGSGGAGGRGGAVSTTVTGAVVTSADRSMGIVAQSVGGSGGNGGFSLSAAASGAGTGSGTVSVGLGGTGGAGADSGTVLLETSADVRTLGAASGGILAQSVGGGGGNGGFNVSVSGSGAGTGSGAVSVGLGGSGAGGGNASSVDLTVQNGVTTAGANSSAIVAQSVGGGGGNGGFNVTVAGSAAGTGSGAASVGLGGSAGTGGNASWVDSSVTGDVQTWGRSSTGLLAQSVGGGGGNGGFNVTAAISGAGTGSGAASVGIGGSGGGGGNADVVTSAYTGAITTTGDNSAGLIAQSLGGGGGNGGLDVAATVAVAKTGAGAVGVGIGGSGGGGGWAGAVTSTVTGSVQTTGDWSTGVLAQSAGGGGGSGGVNVTGTITASTDGSGGASIGIGGFGGDGGGGRAVTSTVTGGVMTGGTHSDAIVAQSLGGGGGNGAVNVSGAVNISKSQGGSLGLGVGGFGGGGGTSADVTLTVATTADNPAVQTTGALSSGVVAQSLGGGGGNGGLNVTGTVTLTGDNGAAVGVGVGGFGGDGGRSGAVTGTITGAVATGGDDSTAIVVQSLGGGGGNGGIDVTAGLGISASGGTGQASIGIGGFGGSGGASGTATLVRTGDTTTLGASSEAIVVQSLAGGGGNGAVNVSGGLTLSSKNNAAINIGIGGFGGGGSSADAVSATIVGNVSATGLGAASADRPSQSGGAVVAQSVGGGGGNGGLNVAGGISLTKSSSTGNAAAIGIGGFGGDGGDAGTVTLDIHAPGDAPVAVVTAGDRRSAVVAQSLGGGGGLGGINVSGGISTDNSLAIGLGGFGGSGGQGKLVTAGIAADLQAGGDGSRGILAQSVGGGGGAGGIDVAGTVAINSSNDTSVTFGLGGFGGAGNVSGAVNLTQAGALDVRGANAFGILAQSVAGGGGDGGLNVSANIANASAGKSTSRIVAGVGGSAGTGADAGGVTLSSIGAITVVGPTSTSTPSDPGARTTAFSAGGILAQSIGGGGGNGGMNITSSVARNAGNTLQFGMGGSGATGGHAGAVTVTRGYVMSDGTSVASPALLATGGDYANGLVAQSVGGGGGTAGMNFNFAYNQESGTNEESRKYAAAIVSVGGSGANAGNGAGVTVLQDGGIATDGAFAAGLIAQSIGGGGGSANVNLGAGKLGDKTSGINIGVGGASGAGGSGGEVSVDHVGQIVTQGYASIGLKAQSIGGGGGSAQGINQYLDPVLDFITGQLDSASLTINVGRAGGAGGTGGAISVSANGLVETSGSQSIGLFAQSVGGGGGDSGTTTVGGDFKAKSSTYKGNVAVGLDGGSGATGGAVTVTAGGQIVTAGERAHAIFAQSVGGGGGMGGTVGDKLALSSVDKDVQDTTSAAVHIGGTSGSGSFASQVSVTSAAALQTAGDRSSGIWAQSVGGSGGAGGDYLNASIHSVGSGKTSRSFSVNVGGTGGTGATGGGVTVSNSGLILTGGLQSFGIRADSVGGGGGDGGAVSQGSLTLGTGSTQSVNVNVGGSGGWGGAGGAVSVTNTGTVLTGGDGAEGIRATSTGGGGGNAGVMITALLRLTGGDSQTQNLTFNYGGSSGTGGTGGAVTVLNTATGAPGSGAIQTEGDDAHGIFAQSLGGGGGNGSSIISMTGLRGSKASVSLGLNVGGSGGTGNTAGTVGVTTSGAIQTSGRNAYGILAQSIGGGGGDGGLVIDAAAAFGEKASVPVLSVGGAGGTGGDGGDVLVSNTGSIVTTGAGSHGIVAQSIGGGGGNAGVAISAQNDAATFAISNVLSLVAGAVGGGTGGTGGRVTVVQDGDITVTGAGAQAIVAESINGGGGHLAFDLSGVTGLPGLSFKQTFGDLFGIGPDDAVSDPTIATRLGGDDLGDMNANAVTVTSTGTFGATGRNAVASADQSIGGGGGSLFVTATQDAGPAAITYALGMGGSNLTTSAGGAISTTHTGRIVTTGFNAPGLISQSIGGGGGRALFDITAGEGSSIGGFAVSLGSLGGSALNGGDITRRQAGAIVTTEALSTGAVLQSIGGGGGWASLVARGPGVQTGSPVQADAAVRRATGGIAAAPSTAGAEGVEPAASTVSLGASGGVGLNGGSIVSTFSGGVSTTGAHSLGLLQQSIGAGGGAVQYSGGGALTVALGGSGTATGNGGHVTLSHTGDVETRGAGADGIFLQSIGGGGGAVFTDLAPASVGYTLSAANAGDGGDIRLNQTGHVLVHGDGAVGVLAQSLGGGGGVIDRVFADTAGGLGASGSIALVLDGSVVADGVDAIGVFAQSRGTTGQGNISIELAPDQIIYAGPNGVAVQVSGGAANRFLNNGSVGTLAGVDGWAMIGGTGNELVDNTGLFSGQVDLGAGVNTFVNHAGAVVDPGTSFLLGAPTNRIVNSGLLSPGAVNREMTTNLAGSLEQTPTGTYLVDLDLVGVTADRINATGTASVGGTVQVNLPNLAASVPYTKSGTRDLTIVSAAQGTTTQPPALQALQTAVVTHSLVQPNATDIVLREVIDYAGPASLSRNEAAVGRAINRIQFKQTSSAAFGPIATALFFQTDSAALGETYDMLGASATSGHEQLAFLSGDRFISAVGRQAASRIGLDAEGRLTTSGGDGFAGGGRNGPGSNRAPAAAPRDWSAWMTGFNGTSGRPGSLTEGSAESSEDGDGFAAGIDYRLRPNLILGFAGGSGEFTFDSPSFATSGRTKAKRVAGYVAAQRGDGYVTASFGFGFFSNTVARAAVLPPTVVPVQPGDAFTTAQVAPGAFENLLGSFSSHSIEGSIEAGRTRRFRALDFTPFAGLQFARLSSDRYAETVASGESLLGLIHLPQATWSVPGVVGLQVRGGGAVRRNLGLSVSTRVAWRHEFEAARATEGAFITAPDVSFLVNGAEPPHNAFRASVEVRGVLFGHVSIYGSFRGDFARGVRADIARSLGVAVVW